MSAILTKILMYAQKGMRDLLNDSKSHAAAVFLHGFLGGPQQFEFLLPIARECGYDPHALLLPGHGGNFRAFMNSNGNSWEAYVQAELDRLRGRYERLLLVGHSMGGLLSILAALRDARGICGIFAIALPLNLRVSHKGMQTNWKHVTGLGEADAYTQAARSSCSVAGITLWNAPLMLPRVTDLTRLSAKARRGLGGLRVPLTILHSLQDEWVSPRSLQTAKSRCFAKPEIFLLSESGHFLYPEADRQQICDHFASFAAACNISKECDPTSF